MSIAVQGTELEYTEQGQGDPVVFVHGTLGDLRSWQPQIDAFAQHHHVVSYSRRYHHPNSCRDDGNKYSAAVHAADLAALVAALGLRSAHVVGSSYGAYTALMLGLNHPDCVRSLVLSEPPVLPLLEDHPEGAALRDEFLAQVWSPVGEILQAGDTEQGIRTFVDGLFDHGTFDQLPSEVRDLIMDNACEFILEATSPDFWTPFSRDDAARVHAPTLLLSGGRSLRMFQIIVDELERSLPRCERVTVGESAHDLPGEHPEAFNEIVLAFLAGAGRHSSKGDPLRIQGVLPTGTTAEPVWALPFRIRSRSRSRSRSGTLTIHWSH